MKRKMYSRKERHLYRLCSKKEENEVKNRVEVSSVVGYDLHELAGVHSLHGRVLNVTSIKSIETKRTQLIKHSRNNVGINIISTLLKNSGIQSLVDLGNEFLIK